MNNKHTYINTSGKFRNQSRLIRRILKDKSVFKGLLQITFYNSSKLRVNNCVKYLNTRY